jgi:type IV pilus assembly protein PilY1
MYAADLGGQIWRFDIANGKSANDLVSGGVIASVGGEDSAVDRRFYFAPDVAEVRCGGTSFYNVAIGSGDRENPVNDTSVNNAFFSFRDYLMRTPVDSGNYAANCGSTTDPCFQRIVDDGSQLVDVTESASPAIDTTKAGWKLRLVGPGVPPKLPLTAPGEKALAESRTFANGVYFTTYTPQARDSSGDCGTYVGVNRLYVVNACNAAPVNNFHTEVDSTPTDDRWNKLAQGSIAPEVVFIFPTPPSTCKSRDCMPPPQCLVGLAGCGRGIPNNPVRVFWREQGAE